MNIIVKAIAILALTAATAQAAPIWMTGNDGSSLFTVDSVTGSGTLIGNFGQDSTYTLSFNSTGTLYGISNGYSNGTLVTINQATGQATTVGVATGIADLMALAFAPDGTLYAASWNTDSLYTINPVTGAATLVGALGFGGIMDLDFDSQGDLYGLSSSLFKINLATGAGTLVTNLANSCLMGMAIDSADRFLATDYCTSNTPLYEINTATGALTNLGQTGISNAMGGAMFAADATDVPEPGTWAMIGIGLLGLSAARRKPTRSMA